MIRLYDIEKRFGDFKAVVDLSIEVPPGEIYGFLGPNGAGKTTTIKLLAGLLTPSRGRVVINGHDMAREPAEAKRIIGFIPDRPFIYEKLTGFEFLNFVTGLYGANSRSITRKIEGMLRLFDLEDWAFDLIETYSHGMRQRLIMASALIHDPKVLVVDEPLVGLDPLGARLVKRIFRGFAEKNKTIFMSTHTLEIAQDLCSRIGIISKGRLVAEGTIEELKEQAGAEGSANLEQLFLKLTGSPSVEESLEVLEEG